MMPMSAREDHSPSEHAGNVALFHTEDVVESQSFRRRFIRKLLV
jgi:hypothetical protein